MRSGRQRTVATAIVLGAILLFALARQSNWDWRSQIGSLLKASAPQTPEDSVYKMLDAARAGNTEAYLESFSGEMKTQIAEVINETSRQKFQQYLLKQNSAFTGVAVSVRDRPDADDARLRVEYVYPERNEVQDVYVRKEGSSWRIYKVLGSEQITTLIPYGTAVTD